MSCTSGSMRLTTYMTGVGFPRGRGICPFSGRQMALIAKDIVVPRRLLAGLPDVANLPCPNSVRPGFSRPRREMSKSPAMWSYPMDLPAVGSTSCAISAARDQLRQDGSYSASNRQPRPAQCQQFGNLAQRSLSMIFKNLDGVLAPGEAEKTAPASQVRMPAIRWRPSSIGSHSRGPRSVYGAVFACNA